MNSLMLPNPVPPLIGLSLCLGRRPPQLNATLIAVPQAGLRCLPPALLEIHAHEHGGLRPGNASLQWVLRSGT